MMARLVVLVTLSFGALSWSTPARAGLVLSFDSLDESIAAPGGTASIRVFLSQNEIGPRVTSGNPLLTGAIRISFNSPSGIAAVLNADDVTFGPAWDSGDAATFADRAELALTSLDGLDFAGGPILLGTFTFTGLGPGLTSIVAAELDPDLSDFITANEDILDPITTASASITVGGVVAVPEPSSLLSGSLALLIGLGYSRRRGKAAVARPRAIAS